MEEGLPTTNSLQLVAPVAAIIVVVTLPLGSDAAAIHASELVCLAAGPVVLDTVFVFGQIPTALRRALTLRTLWPWKRTTAT